jgi:methenyltetrahydrofolate cyclohydrolase
MAAAFAGEDTARPRELRARAMELAERELTSYAPVLEASRLPKDDPTRTERLDQALSDAANPPLEIARVAAEVEQRATDLASRGNRSLEGDANTAAELARAARRAAARLVQINLSAHADDPRATEATQLRTKN